MIALRATIVRPILLLLVALPIALVAAPHHAAARPADVQVTADADMRFGEFAVFGRGSRTLSAYGGSIDEGVFAIPGSIVAPAQFTVSYDRGNESRRPIDVSIEVSLLEAGSVTQGGVTAQLSQFVSDLPNAANLRVGEPIAIQIQHCMERICGRTFRVGGRLDVAQSSGGARLTIALPVQAVLLNRRDD